MHDCAHLLLKGEVVAFPTETVYALAADAQNPLALKKLFALKNRPKNKALSLMVADIADVDFFAQNIPPAARCLMDAFFPGPLTLILERSENVPSIATGERNCVGLRMPNHPIAQGVLKEFAMLKKTPIALAAPSANRANALSATTFEHVQSAFGESIARILKGMCHIGLESTIVDCTQKPFLLIRQGAIALESLQSVFPEIIVRTKNKAPSLQSPVFLMTKNEIADFLRQNQHQKTVLLGFEKPEHFPKESIFQAMPKNPQNFAQKIYETLHFAQSQNADALVLESPPKTSEWQLLLDFIHGQRKFFSKKMKVDRG